MLTGVSVIHIGPSLLVKEKGKKTLGIWTIQKPLNLKSTNERHSFTKTKVEVCSWTKKEHLKG